MKKKKHSRIWAVAGIILLGIVAVSSIYSHFGGFGTGPCADETEFMQYADQVDNIKIPEKTKIVALGEASHGNAEFQQLKLSLFQNLVENAGIRAFALEGDYGGCEYVNRYIHGGEGTAEQAAAAIGFAIYRTDEMADLISYMRKYNETAKDGDDLRFYGFDMQRWSYNLQYLIEACEKAGIDVTELKKLEDTEEQHSEYDVEQQSRVITEIKEELQKSDVKDIVQADHLADTLLQNISLGKVINSAVEGNVLRDQLMAENVLWILSMEEQRGNSCIFISGHNGHIERFGNYGAGTGATVGKLKGMDFCMKSGIGSYAVKSGALMAGAVVAVNSLGDVYDWKTGQKVAGLLAENKRSFGDSEMELLNINEVMDNKFVGNTTIAVFFTNARFDKTKLGKIAGMAHDGYARSIRPVHTTADGDSIYAVSLGEVNADLDVVGTLAARVISEAIIRAVEHADSAYGYPATRELLTKK